MADLRIVDAPEIPTENITGEEKLPTGGNGNYSISLDSLADYTKTKKDLADNASVDTKVNGVRQELDAHTEDLLNPHQVTKGQIGLGNVDNTADADKPVSNSTQAAIISAVFPKADKTYVDTQLALKANKVDVYTKAETYTKQESNALVNNSISTALTPVNTSLDLAKRGIANRYDSSLTYNSGERVVLTNGDIVKSTIDGNTNNPNVGMTGWVLVNSDSQITTWSGRTQEEKNKERISILDFGGKAQSGFDNSTAMNAAYLYSESAGGCTIVIPASGNNNYEFMDYVYAKSNTTVIVDDTVTLDLTAMQVGESYDGVWKFYGSIEPEINLSANATRGDTILTINNHGLQVGDFAVLKGQRNAFSLADAGADWKLGRPTTTIDHHALYFGEPIIVKRVISANQIEIESGLIFPNYRIDKTQETSARARPCTTVQKLNMIKNSFVKGGRVVCDGSTAFRTEYAYKCMIHNVDGYFGNNVGSLYHTNMSYACGETGCRAYRSSGDWLDVSLSQYNSFKQRSSWYCVFDYEDHNGSQGFDSSYNLNGIPSLMTSVIKARGFNQKDNTITFHSGSYGYHVGSVYSVGHQSSAIFLRSRSGVIDNVFLASTALQGSHIRLSEYAVNVQINGGYVEGGESSTGFVIGDTSMYNPSDSVPESQATNKQITLRNLTFKGVGTVGVIRHPNTTFKTTESCGVTLENITAVDYIAGIRVFPYCNSVKITGLRGVGTKATSALLALDNDTVDHDVNDVVADTFGAINLNRIFDRDTFPLASYRTNGNIINNIRMMNGDSGIVNAEIYLRTPIASIGNMFLTPKLQQAGILQLVGASNGTLRLPRTVESIPMKPFTLLNTGTGVVTIVGDSVSTTVLCNRTNGLVVNSGDMVTITMTDIDKWLVS